MSVQLQRSRHGPLKIVRFSSSIQVLASNATATPLQLSGEHRVYSSPVQWHGAQAVLPHLLLLLRWWVDIYVVFVIAVCGVRKAAAFETTHGCLVFCESFACPEGVRRGVLYSQLIHQRAS
jgi:hypothetical protein